MIKLNDENNYIYKIIKNIKVNIEKTDNFLKIYATTPRLIIRSVSEGDIDFYQNNLFGDKDVMEKFGSGKVRLYSPMTTYKSGKPDFAEYIIKNKDNSYIKRWNSNNPWSAYVLEKKDTKEKIGHIIVGGGELAYMLAKKHWNKKYGTEAAISLVYRIIPAIIEKGYKPTFDKIYGTSEPTNIASIKILEKLKLKTDKKIYCITFEGNSYKRIKYSLALEEILSISKTSVRSYF